MEKLKNIFLNKYFLAPTFLMYSYSIWKRNVNKELKGATFDSKIYKPLEKKEASRRHDHVSNISYDLLLNLSNLDNNMFKGEIIIEFFLSQVENLFLDFTGKIESLQVNNKICLNSSEYKKKANRIYIEERVLNKGMNVVKIEFEQSYGVEDGLIYCKNRNSIYSKCESFKAHHIFPCFDQPSFKTKFKLKIISDKNIEFISNSNLINNILLINNKDFNSTNFNTLSLYPANYDNSDKNKEFRIYEFLEISKIATHQIFICGIHNYKQVLQEEFKDSPIHIKIHQNKNINNNDLISRISRITREYINWFEDIFQTKYPFNRLSINFLKEVTNLSMSFPGGIIVLDEKFLESDLDTIDSNYFYLILATHV
jgi:aminopeptidase N